MQRLRLRELAVVCAMACVPASAAAEDHLLFAGGMFGVSALSADARAVTTGSGAALSLYEPRNGPALDLFAGVHLASYFSIQVSWMWNRNDLTLVSSSTAAPAGGFYEQPRESRQHAVVLDGLVYFRRRDSPIRPYLGTGLSFLRFSSRETGSARVDGLAPPGEIASNRIGLRSHVGIDFRLTPSVALRYSFSETISANPISPSLTPPGRRGLMNFENLFGLVARF